MTGLREVSSLRENDNLERPKIDEVNKSDVTSIEKLSGFSDSSYYNTALKKMGFSLNDVKRHDDGKAGYGKYLEKGDDGKYHDKETGREYASVDEWKKGQITLGKRYDSTAGFYREKANKEWARFKKSEINGESAKQKWDHYQTSQECYIKARENKEKGNRVWERLEEGTAKLKIERVNNLLPRNGGEWSGVPGNSEWKPNPDVEPGDRHGTNPEHKSWKQIMEKYKFDSIPFLEGAPDFHEVSKGTVEIDDFSEERDANFDQADEKMAERRGCTPEEVAKWREENKYTWHECKDCKTMMKVPTEVHGNISHSGS